MELLHVLFSVAGLLGLMTLFVSRARTAGALLRHAGGVAVGAFCFMAALAAPLIGIPTGLAPVSFSVSFALLAWSLRLGEADPA